jgi:uncharacterized membrane protein
MRRQVIATLAVAIVSLLARASARSATLDYIPGPPGGPAPTAADAVGGDGTVAAGTLVLVPGQSHHLYRWTRGGGTVDLGAPLGRDFNLVTDVSDDGSTIVGWAFNDTAAGGTLQAFRWTPAGGFSSLGTVPGYVHSTAAAVSADGSVVVGTALRDNSSPDEGARWTAGTGMVLLPLSAGQAWGLPVDVSANGAVAVGLSSSGSDARATRWTPAGPEFLAGMPATGSAASAANADGTVIAGNRVGASAGEQELFRWTEAGGLERLGDLPGGPVDARAVGISADGSIIGGNGVGPSGLSEGFLWDAVHGIRSLKDILAASGIATGGTRLNIAGLSADGTTVVGTTNDNRAFVAVVPEPTGLAAGVLLLGMTSLRRTRRRAA